MNLINKITKEEFENLKTPILFTEKNAEANNNLASISNGINGFRIAWNSDINPILLLVSRNIYAIGIDQHFAVVDFESQAVLLNIDLFYNFYDIKIFSGFIYVITELEIIKINLLSYTLVETYPLPDYFENIEFNDRGIEVKCLGGEIVTI